MINNSSLNTKEKSIISAWNGMSSMTPAPAFEHAKVEKITAFEDTSAYKPQTANFEEKHYLKDYFTEIPSQETHMVKNPWLVMDEYVKI